MVGTSSVAPSGVSGGNKLHTRTARGLNAATGAGSSPASPRGTTIAASGAATAPYRGGSVGKTCLPGNPNGLSLVPWDPDKMLSVAV